MSGGLAARMKGQRYERELASLINEKLGLACRRGFQANPQSQEADIEGFLPGFHIEAKRQEKTNIWQFMRQAKADAKDGEIPLVVTRRNREPSLAVLWFEDLLDLIARLERYRRRHREVLEIDRLDYSDEEIEAAIERLEKGYGHADV